MIFLLPLALAITIVGCGSPSVPEPAEPQPTPLAPHNPQSLPRGAAKRLGTLRFRHAPRVNVAAYSHDGKTIASLGRDRAVRFWNAADGMELRRVVLTDEWTLGPCSVAFGHKGRFVAVSAGSKVALVPTGPGELRYLPKREDDVTGVVFSPDDKLLAVFGRSGSISLVDTATGKDTLQLTGFEGEVTAAIFSPDGKQLAAVSYDHTIRFWTIADGKIVRKLDTGDVFSFNLALSPDGKCLAWDDGKGHVRVHDLTTDKEIDSFVVGKSDGLVFSAIGTLRFTPTGALEAWGYNPPTLCVWEPKKPVRPRVFEHLVGKPAGGRLSPDGKRVLFWDENGPALRLMNVETGREIVPDPDAWAGGSPFAVLPDGCTLVCRSEDGTIRLSDFRTGREVRRWTPHGGLEYVAALSANGKVLASFAGEGEKEQGFIRLWDPSTGREIRKWRAEGIRNLVFSADGTVLFSAERTSVRAWNALEGKLIREMEEVPEAKKPSQRFDFWEFFELAATPDGKVVTAMMARGKRRVYLWDATTGKRLPGWDEKGLSEPLLFSPDGKTFVAVREKPSEPYDHDLPLWGVATGKEQGSITLTEGGCGSIAFSPDGKLLAVGDEFHGEIHLWSLPDAKRVARFQGPEGRVRVLFSLNDELISVGSDSALLVWDLRGVRQPAPK